MLKVIIASFSALLSGPPEAVGPGFKWKQSCLTGAIVGTLFSPIYTYQNSLPYRGELPPAAPLIRGIGLFELINQKNGFKNAEVVHLRGINGKDYIVQDGESLLPSNVPNSGTPFLVEGFLLKSGRGNFWPTTIKDLHGNNAANQEVMRKALALNRDPFGSLLVGMWLFTAPFWMISIFNAIILMRSREGR
ncbi:hypothetical protein EN871_31330 [bacterium M00.F.Ca.ET.228.01.1.1]|nr:hypothetical protein EN871_31330 [bacterium M00.F.Ca.ET.228.01.1.1]TGR95558.1 hypothetical protein EN834_30935 [bacterium M00.F.Ca.ET.191.01.1.1]TGT96546.1 hypothetical protein EN798_30945 [bacterium M00.F.Ca.ET.155.01.1.1]